MADYSIGELAEMAGISVRTLRYYDQIGLLRPARRARNGYRRYQRRQLLRLQQILLFREFELPLDQIRAVLDSPGFQPLPALISHRQNLVARRNKLDQLVKTLDRTIESLKEEGEPMLSDEELFAGFSPEQADRYRQEARQRWGEQVEQVENQLRRLSAEEWAQVNELGEQVAADLAELMDLDHADDQVQEIVGRHHRWVENFYPVPSEVYLGLSELYVQNEEFKAYYDRFKPGLAEFLSQAMKIYARSQLE